MFWVWLCVATQFVWELGTNGPKRIDTETLFSGHHLVSFTRNSTGALGVDLNGQVLGQGVTLPANSKAVLVQAPKNADTPVFLLDDRQTMWGSQGSGKILWKLEEAELVEKMTECADGRVAVLTNERLLSVKNLGSG